MLKQSVSLCHTHIQIGLTLAFVVVSFSISAPKRKECGKTWDDCFVCCYFFFLFYSLRSTCFSHTNCVYSLLMRWMGSRSFSLFLFIAVNRLEHCIHVFVWCIVHEHPIDMRALLLELTNISLMLPLLCDNVLVCSAVCNCAIHTHNHIEIYTYICDSRPHSVFGRVSSSEKIVLFLSFGWFGVSSLSRCLSISFSSCVLFAVFVCAKHQYSDIERFASASIVFSSPFQSSIWVASA